MDGRSGGLKVGCHYRLEMTVASVRLAVRLVLVSADRFVILNSGLMCGGAGLRAGDTGAIATSSWQDAICYAGKPCLTIVSLDYAHSLQWVVTIMRCWRCAKGQLVMVPSWIQCIRRGCVLWETVSDGNAWRENELVQFCYCIPLEGDWRLFCWLTSVAVAWM